MKQSYAALGVLLFGSTLTQLSIAAEARTPERMMQECRVRAHEVLHTRLPNIETKYEGQRTDGSHAVNGTAWIRGRTETFQCNFNRRGRRMTRFVLNNHGAGGIDREPSTRNERVRFPSGTNGTELKGKLGPGHSVRYLLRANKNQFLYFRLATRNHRTYFNIFTPDGNTLYESVRAGDTYRGQLWLRGDHIVEVYNRSRRQASYNAIFGVTNRDSQSGGTSGDRDPYASVKADCVAAVAKQIGGGKRPTVIRVVRGENMLKVPVRVPGAQAPWICEHSTRRVISVYYGSRG